ncbi:hypothetical protein ACD591_05360 [Rufibacter glacialis]|uniref:Uncharacterized protein n=1 Tax=Rufibacter glacialis TaxID=1259555 RepID=A0ABV4RE82_9BACT
MHLRKNTAQKLLCFARVNPQKQQSYGKRNLSLTGKDLLELGYPKDKTMELTIQLLTGHFTETPLEEQRQLMTLFLANPAEYLTHAGPLPVSDLPFIL